MKLSFPQSNNLEWMRLFFATQVLVEHGAIHSGLALPEFISHLPGVPAFFFVSGFLIYASYLNAPGWRYFENRFLRLFPGLVFVTIGGAGVVVIADGWIVVRDNPLVFVSWFFAQITLGQAFNPSLFRDVGVGVINGSLWTITTEILFYLCVPIVVRIERKYRFAVLIFLGVSFAIYATGPLLFAQPIYRGKTLYDVLALTPLTWGWMFCVGILAAKYFDLVLPYLKWLGLAAVPLFFMAEMGDGLLFGSIGNRLGLLYFLCYVSLVLYFSFWLPYLRLPFDLSYGIYVWHMPVINLLLVLKMYSMSMAVSITFAFAILSCFLVERPMLRRKQGSLKSV